MAFGHWPNWVSHLFPYFEGKADQRSYHPKRVTANLKTHHLDLLVPALCTVIRSDKILNMNTICGHLRTTLVFPIPKPSPL